MRKFKLNHDVLLMGILQLCASGYQFDEMIVLFLLHTKQLLNVSVICCIEQKKELKRPAHMLYWPDKHIKLQNPVHKQVICEVLQVAA